MAEERFFQFGSVERIPETKFAEGMPGEQDDLRFIRPYFVVPFLDQDEVLVDADEALTDATRRVSAKLDHLESPITDVYMISHGWHRNIYSAVAAYDRLMSRFATLVRRGRIEPPEGWNPLFLTLHWHSDLGRNDWVDQSGRRDKGSFLRNAFDRLQPRSDETDDGAMRTVFEEVFEFFVKICAPEIDPFAEGIAKDSKRLGKMLEDYTIRDAPSASHEEVISAAWTCYHEATLSKPVSEQDEGPGDFTRPFAYVMSLIRIVIAVIGLSAFLGFVLRNQWIGDRWEAIEDWLEGRIVAIYPEFLQWPVLWKSLGWGTATYLAAWATLGVVILLYRSRIQETPVEIKPGPALDPRRRIARRAKGLKTSGTLAWALLQAVHSLPILGYCLLTPLFASPLIQAIFLAVVLYLAQATAWLYGLAALSLVMFIFSRFQYQERSMSVGGPPSGILVSIFRIVAGAVGIIRRFFVKFARLPIRAISNVASPGDRAIGAWQAVDNQFVFWDMVEKAVASAERASTWLGDLVIKHPNTLTKDTRIHIFGHSHGGLLVVNLARLWSYQAQGSQPKLQTVGTICGAFMSSWLRGEPKLIQDVQGCIACVYSRYDVANSFWYPLANIGRKAAGYVGLWMGEPHPDSLIGEPLPYASISKTPDLAHRVRSVGQDPKQKRVLNIDGSRLIFDGPVVPQGAHGDIFKDDIVQLLWATTRFGEDRARQAE